MKRRGKETDKKSDINADSWDNPDQIDPKVLARMIQLEAEKAEREISIEELSRKISNTKQI